MIAIAGGGTAGHVFPGIAVAEELGRNVVWIGSSRGVERGLVTEAGIPFHGIPAGKLRRYLSLRNLTDVLRVAAGVFASLRILRKERPRLLFSKGGYVSVPPVVAARLFRIPAFTHESDFDPGLATRINLRLCERVLVSYPQTLEFLPPRYREKAIVTGNPVRAAFYAADPRKGRSFVGCDAETPLLLVLGGSLGSSSVNRLIEAARPRLTERWFVVHQMGAREARPAREARYHAAAFFQAELPDLMAAARIVVCRAGANTLAELAALGRPSVLIPLPASGSRGDQIRNAELFRSRGAASVLREEEATADALVSLLDSLLAEPGRLVSMGTQAKGLSAGVPAREIARLIRARIS